MKLLLLCGITGVVWAVAAGVAAAVDGPGHWLPSGIAALLCLLPAAGTLVAAGWTARRTPVEAVGFILVAPVIRLVVGLVGGVALGLVVPELKAEPARFALWGAGLYVVVLVTEAALLLAGPKANGSAPRVTIEPRGG